MLCKKTLFGVVGVALVCFLLGASLSYGTAVSQTHINSGGKDASGDDFVVWFDGDATYYAKNSYGALSYSGSDFIVVLQSCHDALSVNGGNIYVTEGEYEVGSVLNITNDRIHLYGDGRSSVFKSASDTDYMIVVDGVGVVSYIDIDNLCFYNPNIATYNLTAAILFDVSVDSIFNSRVSECVFLHMNAIWSNLHADHDRNLCHASFVDLTVEQPSDYCFKFYDAIDLNFERVYILCDSYDVGVTGLYYNAGGVSAGTRINAFRCVRAGTGIVVEDMSDVSITNSICDLGIYGYRLIDVSRAMFTNDYASTDVGVEIGYSIEGESYQNRFVNCEAFGCDVGFNNSAGVNYVQIFDSCDTASCTSSYALQTGDYLYGDTTFITEASSANAIVSGQTSVVVTHGLSYTPVAQDIHVTPTVNPTADVGTMWISDITSTTFKVNVENDPSTSGYVFSWSVSFMRRTP